MIEAFPKRVYFIAISGTGMSALAGLFQSQSCVISGSDLACYSPVKELLQGMGVEVQLSYDVNHLKKFKPDLVVIGNFVRKDNPQAQYVLSEGIPYLSFPAALEKFFLQQTCNMVVAGTHGKSTTASALAVLLDQLGESPSFLIGAIPHDLGKSFHRGKGKAFVLEGDEYDTAFFDKESKFLHYKPKILVWTSLEFDHADIFEDLAAIERMFRKLIRLVPEEGAIFYCADYPRISEMMAEERGELKAQCIESYGFSEMAQHRVTHVEESQAQMSFRCSGRDFRTKLSGNFNVLNLLGASLAASFYGKAWDEIQEALPKFTGLKRRQEIRFERAGRRVIDDFAHHPSAVANVLEGIKARYPEEPLIVVFEARSNTTRRAFFQDVFVKAFEKADEVILAEVFKAEDLPETDRLDVPKLVAALSSGGVRAAGPLQVDKILLLLKERLISQPGNVLVLSNGSFDGLVEKLISEMEGHKFEA